MARQLRRRLAGQALLDFRYRDFGSRVSLGHQGALGDLLTGLRGGSLMVEGLIARAMYESLYKRHEAGLHGWPKVALDSLARWLGARTEPRVKLH
jgi:NADH dehydrogenase